MVILSKLISINTELFLCCHLFHEFHKNIINPGDSFYPFMLWHLQQAVENGEQLCEGTHRFAEPVSNTTLNICAGEPMPISPKY